MREKFFILAVILGTIPAIASDCLYGDCGLDLVNEAKEDFLVPNNPPENLWSKNISAVATVISEDQETKITSTDYCPFDTELECEIWRTKPMVSEVVAPRSKQIQDGYMTEFLSAVESGICITGDHPAAAPFLQRYKQLVQSARSCCTEGMTYSLRDSGASKGLVYKNLVDDANFYNMYDRCLMTTDNEINATYQDEEELATMAKNVRNECLCRSRSWYTAMLAPFVDAWRASPTFAASPFYWTYTDGVGRTVDVSINNDVETVLRLLEKCP